MRKYKMQINLFSTLDNLNNNSKNVDSNSSEAVPRNIKTHYLENIFLNY